MKTTPKVAIVDDERHVREMLELGLAREGYTVRSAADGAQALDLVGQWEPDIIILDVMLPKIDGFTLLPMLRKKTEAPIIMLTAKGDIPDKVVALDRGADDYLAKPFAFEELLARLGAALRRPKLAAGAELRYDDLTVNVETREVLRGGRRIGLTPREFDLLVALIRVPRRVLTKEQLLEQVWGHDFEGEVGIVETYISYLRAKVDGGESKRIIHTVRGVGYALREDDLP
ncbi:MAG TPA: response regulator transcription factor [Candidatus Eremiobacteraceae bacterium]|nr:response regulator transcription factor [Candidatus Eremiobacteraceae bacterium]